MTQYHVNHGPKIFGVRGEEAVLKELQHYMSKSYGPNLCKRTHTRATTSCSPVDLMFLKEKRSGVIKGRGCVNGRPQRLHMTKEETSSPTAQLNLSFVLCH